MAKKASKKATKKVAKKKVAKKASKRVAKKASKKVAKKASKKVAKKVAKHHKAKPHKRKAKRKLKQIIKVKGGVAVRGRGKKKRKFKRHDTKSRFVRGKHTRLSAIAKRLKKGESLSEVVQYAPKKRKTKKGVKLGKSKMVKVTAVALNPKHKRKHHKKRNPIIQSNPMKFLKNPMGGVSSMIQSVETKVVSALAPVDKITRNFLNMPVLELAGLVAGATFDGKVVEAVDWVASKVGLSSHVAKIPAQYKAPALTGGAGLLLHALNSFMAKKGGKKSIILEELSKGLIASSLVKLAGHMSKWSVENCCHPSGVAGYVMSGMVYEPHMGGYVMANPSASMATGNTDFSGADFEGADYGTSSIGGADFEGGYGGYVQTMGEDAYDVVGAKSAEEAVSDENDFSYAGTW